MRTAGGVRPCGQPAGSPYSRHLQTDQQPNSLAHCQAGYDFGSLDQLAYSDIVAAEGEQPQPDPAVYFPHPESMRSGASGAKNRPQKTPVKRWGFTRHHFGYVGVVVAVMGRSKACTICGLDATPASYMVAVKRPPSPAGCATNRIGGRSVDQRIALFVLAGDDVRMDYRSVCGPSSNGCPADEFALVRARRAA